jgi:hypothetical protein
MDKRPLIVVSLCAVVLLVLGALSNCLRVETVQGCDCGDPPCWPVLGGKMGNNNWYISSVTLAFNGSITVHYRIDGGTWQTYSTPLALTFDGKHILEWTCDNSSEIYSIEIKIDKTAPILNLSYTWAGRNRLCGFVIIYSAYANDILSGMNRTEFYRNYVLQKTIFGSQPVYVWEYPSSYMVRGFIVNPEILEEYVKFRARIVMISGGFTPPFDFDVTAIAWDNAGNYAEVNIFPPIFVTPIITPRFYLFRDVTLPNNYTGYIREHFIKATFYNT